MLAATLYAAAGDLMPKVNDQCVKRIFVSLSVFSGVALFFIVHYALHTNFGKLELCEEFFVLFNAGRDD